MTDSHATDARAALSQRAARERFSELVSGSDDSIDLAEAALCIAGEHVALNMAGCLSQLAELADAVRPSLEAMANQPLSERVDRFNQFLFQDEKFRGCQQDDYYRPHNSFLNEVLERRQGIPIALSILYVDIARRVGLQASGVGFPGHFLVRVDVELDSERQPDEVAGAFVIDPFIGRRVDREECVTRLKSALGPGASFDSGWLRAASPREILVRVLGNLKHNYLAAEDWASALLCMDRSLLVLPDSPVEIRDRGILYQHLECFGAAADDLERFLELEPDHESAEMIRKTLSSLRGRSTTIH